MKNFLKYIFAGVVVSVSMTSCTDMLDKSPLTEISQEDLWRDPALIEAYVNSVYNQVGHGWTESMLASACDECELTWVRGCEVVNMSRLSPSDLGRMNGAWYGWDNRGWSTKWNNIAKCNIILENIDDAPFTDESHRTRLKGEVKYLRAFEYNDLITRWGGVPLITRSFTIDDVEIIRDQKRATYEECVDFMTRELTEASELLPTTFSGNSYGRATSVAALTLKAQILLFAASPLMNENVTLPQVGYPTPKTNRWEVAAKAADEAVKAAEQAGYALYQNTGKPETDYQQLFLDGSEANKEVIFARMGTSSTLGDNLCAIEQYNFPNGYGGWGGNCPLQELIDDYEVVENGVARAFDWDNPADAAAPYENRDPRFYATILYDGAEWKGREVETWISEDEKSGGRDSRFGQDSWNTSKTGYYMKKFMSEEYVGNSWQTPAKNFIWLRLGELYLDQAEANAMAGNENVARTALNKVRARAGMPDVTASGDALVNAIRHERRVELCFEENRYFDVRRWKLGHEYLDGNIKRINITKKADGTKTYKVGDVGGDMGTRIFLDKCYWLPILRSEIDKNGNLVQNPGYDK